MKTTQRFLVSHRRLVSRLALVAAAALVLAGCQRDAPPENPAAAPEPAIAAPAPATADGAPAAAPGDQGAPAADAATVPVAAAATIPADMSVAEMLSAAREALNDERIVRPAGNSALEFYLGVLAKEPNNPTAAQALVDIFPMAVTGAERDIAQSNFAEAERIALLLDVANPGSFSVRSLRERVAAARAQETRALAEQERLRAEAERERIAAAEAPATPAPVAVTPEPAALPEPTPEPAAPPPQASVAPVQPPPVAAAPVAPVGETRSARPLRQVSPEFPADAARRRQEGWVELRFTIGVDGRVSNVQVVRSQPQRVFDRAAISAIERWTFEPALRNGEPVPTQAARRLEFRL